VWMAINYFLGWSNLGHLESTLKCHLRAHFSAHHLKKLVACSPRLVHRSKHPTPFSLSPNAFKSYLKLAPKSRYLRPISRLLDSASACLRSHTSPWNVSLECSQHVLLCLSGALPAHLFAFKQSHKKCFHTRIPCSFEEKERESKQNWKSERQNVL
jgi:hypothetical protein